MNDLQRVHFIAIGGTGMGSLAGLLKARGIEVTGSEGGARRVKEALGAWLGSMDGPRREVTPAS